MPNQPKPLILASKSPRRKELLTEAGYEFLLDPADDSAECGICSRETPPELVARLAFQKAKDVAQRTAVGTVLGCDTVAECHGQVLGKPVDRDHARQMLQLLRGRPHHVYSGICLWVRPNDHVAVQVDRTRLQMDAILDQDIEAYLDSGLWQGKAGAFGYQDRLGWVHVVEGSESNVVGLPLELLARMFANLDGDSSCP
ncbi:MAG: nucleoside triphosphate pyrophosphatase [Pirellulaceae bacterium]